MSLNNEVDNSEKKVYIECSCGTHGIRLSHFEDDDYLYLAIFSQNFYNKQKDPFFIRLGKKIKFIWSIIRGKEYLLEEFILKQEDVNQLLTSLNEVKK